MKFTGLLIAAVLLAALGGLVYWSEARKKADAGKPAADAPPKILTIPEDQLKTVDIKKKDGEETVVTRSDANKWQITKPQPLPADQDSVTSIVSTVSSLTSDRLIEDKASDLATYGLNQPVLVVTLTRKDGKSDKLLLGDDTPTGGGVFAKLENDPRVFTVGSFTKTSLDKTTKDLRDKRLLTFDSDKVTRVELQAKGPAVEFGKNNQNEWQILKPKPLRADGSQVDDLIRKLKDAKMDLSLSDEELKKAPGAFAGGTRVAVATVTDANGSQKLEVHKDKDKNYYARSSAVEGVYKIAGDIGDGLDKALDDFRAKKLFDFGFSDPGKVEIRTGDKTVSYQKSGEKWMSASKQMDPSSVQGLIDKLRDLSATKFPETGGGAPVIEATVTSNEGKRVEKVAITKQGENYFARRENEPAIYELDPKAVEALQKAAGEVKEAAPPAPAQQQNKK